MKQKLILLTIALVGVIATGAVAQLATTPVRADDTLKCTILPQSICNAAKEKNPQSSGVILLLRFVLNILTAGIGIVAVAAFVYAGILYSSAGDNANQVSKAKTIMTDTAIGIVAFGLLYLALKWLLPGDVLG